MVGRFDSRGMHRFRCLLNAAECQPIERVSRDRSRGVHTLVDRRLIIARMGYNRNNVAINHDRCPIPAQR